MSLCLSIYLSICLSVCLSVCLSIYLSLSLSIYLSIYLPTYLSIYLSIYLYVFMSIYLYIYMSMYLYIYVSICLRRGWASNAFQVLANTESQWKKWIESETEPRPQTSPGGWWTVPETFNKSVMKKSKWPRYQVVATTHCDIVVLVLLGCLVYHTGNWTNHSMATSWEWDTYDRNITNFIWDLGLSSSGGPQVERQVVFTLLTKRW